MVDIFLSYSSKDRHRAVVIQEALAAQGFHVFWDQNVPPGTDWDTWIREHLNISKCAIVLWSLNAAASRNVRHETTIAEGQGKLISVLIEPLKVEQFPLGLYTMQAVNLSSWTGNVEDSEWKKLKGEIEAKLTPLWLKNRLRDIESKLHMASNITSKTSDISFNIPNEIQSLTLKIRKLQEQIVEMEELDRKRIISPINNTNRNTRPVALGVFLAITLVVVALYFRTGLATSNIQNLQTQIDGLKAEISAIKSTSDEALSTAQSAELKAASAEAFARRAAAAAEEVSAKLDRGYRKSFQ